MVPEEAAPRKLALVMVGLPARGKTYIARKISRYLCWLGYQARVFNVGNYRRARLGANQVHSFFSPENQEGVEARRKLALAALKDMLKWLRQGGDVGIYDATNSTRERRQWVYERCQAEGVQVVFIESLCDANVVEQNVREVKLKSPDYVDVDPDKAAADFRARIAHYERSYEPVEEQSFSYVKLIDVGRQVVVNRIEGYLASKLIFFLMNIHTRRRRIWLTRHGETEFNVLGRIGGNSELTASGRGYSKSLASYLDERVGEYERLLVWTSTMRRTRQTVEPLTRKPHQWRILDEIDAGVCEEMTYQEIRERYPDEYAARQEDKLRYRYPNGESYSDVINRLEPLIVELERQPFPVLVVAHQAVLRCLYGYLIGRPQEECPHIRIPLHMLIELTPTAYGYEERRVKLGPELERTSNALPSSPINH